MTNFTRIPVLLLSCLTGCVLLAVPAIAAKSVESTLTVKYKEADASDPYGKSTFKGTVGPKKCAKGRTVTVKGYGSDKTNKQGKFEIELSGPAFPGKYKVKVAEEEIGKTSCGKVRETLTVR